jgi:DNA-binding NarL/FixJ family response regulator
MARKMTNLALSTKQETKRIKKKNRREWLMKLSELTKPELEKIKENANFTDEELRIFKLLSQDKSITDIAVRMSASSRTINRKISKIKQKISKLEVLND